MLKEKKNIVEFIKEEKFMLSTGLITTIIVVFIAFQNILMAFLFLVFSAFINGLIFRVHKELEISSD